jgi:hypothetical protein
MEFRDRADYHAFWERHPAFGGLGGPLLAEYLDRDLTGAAPHLRSACRADAIREDAEDELRNPEVFAAVHELTVPARLLWAERGLRDEPGGLYGPEAIAASGLTGRGTAVHFVPDVNHYSLVLGRRGAGVVASHIADALGRTRAAG